MALIYIIQSFELSNKRKACFEDTEKKKSGGKSKLCQM